MVNEKGEAYTANMLRNDFDDARKQAGIDKATFQIRDLRGKAATEAEEASGIRTAQSLLGHTTETMTTNYVRNKVGKKLRPLKEPQYRHNRICGTVRELRNNCQEKRHLAITLSA